MHLLRSLLLAAMTFVISTVSAGAASLIRDADIEYALGELAAPVLQAAGLNPSRVRVLLVDDSSLNAFVIDTRYIFIHTGLLQRLTSAGELQAVIAHEAAHIANGHITRRMANFRSAKTAAGIGMALAAVAAASGAGEAAVGFAAGAQSSATRLFLAHTRAEEASADQSAVRFMARAGVDPRGAVKVMEMFSGQELLAEHRQDPYTRSHPLSRDRVRALNGFVTVYGKDLPEDPTAAYWFDRASGKLSGFTRAPAWTLRRAEESVSADITWMRRAAAYHRQSNAAKALAAIDKSLSIRPGDPFYLDLKGQIQLESRQFANAVQTYAAAVKSSGNNAQVLGGYGRALLAVDQPKNAIKVLEQARTRDYTDGRVLRDLAVAYAGTGQNAMASLVTAERYALNGRMKDAAIHAKRAAGALPQGSGPWQRAQDVLNAAKRAE
ncbi:M48 family metalloprotease [Pseudoprimorskyibacter insulae]|uniref:Beta-barrel assembly-enhancing protease n=1 Tax=Pseudoprimorskyibacter insulae TaxID=1695997 RepID=A0A2R8AXG3_9RHOB|nr:M48 family metalloprotease [Pseudoprimorskyibacter insulae]SPF80713.1 Beta-barrel assembly-enhancing protease [Pseudoprimorskyibacter insulae]